MRKVFLDDLPRKLGRGVNKNKECIDWYNSINKVVSFIYDVDSNNRIEGEIKIIDYKNSELIINYNKNNYSINPNSFSKCTLGNILGTHTKKYKYNIGDIIETKTGKIEIIEQTRIPDGKYTQKAYKYKCLIDGNIDKLGEYSLKNGIGCNVCHGLKILKNYNDIATTHPELIKYFANIEDTYRYTYGSNENIELKCPNCGNIKSMKIHTLIQHGFGCQKCSDGISYPNKFIRNFLDQLNENYIPEYSPEWAIIKNNSNPKLNGKKKYDNLLINHNEIWEVHGLQHYEEGFNLRRYNKVKTFQEEQENDKIKKELAKDNGCKYVIIDARYSDMEYIKNNLLNIHEFKRYDLSKIDWLKCHEFACNTIIKIACDYWNSGINNTKEIGILMKLTISTIIKYLKQGVELGWCDYDPKITLFNARKINGKNMGKPVIQLSFDGEYVAEYESASEAERQIGIRSGNITRCCNNKGKYAGEYKWVFKDDYKETNNYSDKIVIINNKKRIVQLTLNNIFIKEFESISEAEKQTSILRINISKCCLGKRNKTGGFKWMYLEEYKSNINNLNNYFNDIKYRNNNGVKSIIQLNLNGEYIKEWNSIKEAENKLSIKNISNCCRGINKTSGSFRWMYKEDYYNNINNIIPYKKFLPSNIKSVIQLTLDLKFANEYKTIKEAENKTGISSATISLCCKGKRKTAGKFKWMYKEDYEKYIEDKNNIA